MRTADAVSSHLLTRLVTVEVQSTTSTLKDRVRTQAAQYAGLVVLERVELRDDRIVWVWQLCVTRRTCASAASRRRET